MDILKELKNLKAEDVISALRKETLPLVMWGAGSSALEVDYYLRSNGIELADVFVDDEYYKEDLMFNGNPVLSYSSLQGKYNKVNVILGNSNYEKKGQLERKECIAKVYGLFSMSYNVFEKTPLSEIKQHILEFESTYELLEDEKSRSNMLAFLKTRVSGDNQYIMDVFHQETNFFHNEIFQIGRNEVYLDVGAFDGDTIRLFLKESQGSYKQIYAVEPDSRNYERLQQYVEKNQLENIEISKSGAWNKKDRLYFSSSKEQVSGVLLEESFKNDSGVCSISVLPLDDMFDYLEKVTILKINYFEGVKEAVEGSAGILKKYMPNLAITVGFDCRNIRIIPRIIKTINSNYKLFLRFNRGMASCLVLYGTV